MTAASWPLVAWSCLYDPDGVEAWDGVLRLVAFASAEIEPDIGGDPLLPEVGWSWLTGALADRAAAHRAAGGTVTQTTSTRFGDMHGPRTTVTLELRGSWTAARRICVRTCSLSPICSAWRPDCPPKEWPSCPPRDHGRDSPAAASGESGSPTKSSAPLLREPADGYPTRSRPPPAWLGPPQRSPPAPALSPSTPSAPRAIAIASGPTWSSCDALGLARAHRPVTHRYLRLWAACRRRQRDRVDLARRPPGSAVPGRARAASGPALRHRTGRPAARRRAGRPRHDGRAVARVRLEKEHSAADWSTRPLPRSGSPTPRWTSSCSSRCTRSLPASSQTPGRWNGQRRSSRRSGPRRPQRLGTTRGVARPAYTRSAPAGSSRSSDRCGTRATRGPPSGISRLVGCCRIRRSSRPLGPIRAGRPNLPSCRTFRGPRQRRAIGRWWNAVAEALALPEADLPQPVSRADAMPPTSRWRERRSTGGRASCRLPTRHLDARRHAPSTPAEPAGRRHRSQARRGSLRIPRTRPA